MAVGVDQREPLTRPESRPEARSEVRTEAGTAAPIERIEQRVADLVGSLNVLHGELVAVIAAVARSGEWADGSLRSLEHWVCWQTGCSPSSARQLVGLAAARESHPRLSALLSAGELTVDQAAAAVKVRPECDEAMAALAPLSTVTQIRTEVRVSNIVARPMLPANPNSDAADDGRDTGDSRSDAAVGESAADPGAGAGGGAREAGSDGIDEFVGQGFDGDRWWLSAGLSAERGALVRAALEEAHDRLMRQRGGDGGNAVSWADALVDVAARSLAQVPDGRGDVYRVNVFLPLDGPVTLTNGAALPDCVARHLTCDGWLAPVFTEGGVPVAVGRSQRVVPERTRRVVLRRDGDCCANPVCGSRVGLEIHHIVHWSNGGTTDPANLTTLCAGCHRLHHRGRLGISGRADRPDGVVFSDRHGRPLRRPRPNPPPTPPSPPVRRYKHPLGEPLDLYALGDVFPVSATAN